jgi:hypothetical protein
MPSVDAGGRWRTDAAAATPADGALVAVVRSLLLDGGTMLAGADDLLATARDATSPSPAATRSPTASPTATSSHVSGAGRAGVTIELPAVVVDDVLPGVVVLPRTSTDAAVNALADDDGRVHVTLAPRRRLPPPPPPMVEVGA